MTVFLNQHLPCSADECIGPLCKALVLKLLLLGEFVSFSRNIKLDAFRSQTSVWLNFHSVISIITERWSDWLVLLG